jgi:kumamolisin
MLYKSAHITTFVSSGDCGAFDGEQYGQLGVDFPANHPYVIGVGGTILSLNKTGGRADEVVWGNAKADKSKCKNSWGGGGGLSKVYKQPSWQTGSGVKNQYSTGYRQMPDVSGPADYLPIVFEQEWTYGGGTSAAAPIWAAGQVLVNQATIKNTRKYAFGPKIPYLLSAKTGKYHPYFDVTKGDNLYYKATSGWDYGSGFGVPNLADVYNVLASAITGK